MEKRRVVITGMGAITPIGNSVAETWESIKAGKSGIDTITHFDASINKVHYAAEVKNFDPALYMDAKDARKMARFSQYAVAASKMALEDANLLGNAEVLEDTGCILGVGIGGFEVTEANCISYYKSGCVKTAPMTIPELIPNEAGGNVCMQFGLHGPCQAVSTACSSGTDALGVAFDMVRSGRIDCCLAGGAESTINGYAIVSFEVLHALSNSFADDPKKASRPFDKKREGFVMGEGSAILVFEEYEHAKARGAKIYGEIIGFSSLCDGFHLSTPSSEGMEATMRAALANAGIKEQDVDYINMHATATHTGDIAESAATRAVFGDKTPVSATKSYTGHTLGASGVHEFIYSLFMMQDNKIYPTINLEELDPECAGVNMITELTDKELNTVMTNNFAFGGINTSIILKKI